MYIRVRFDNFVKSHPYNVLNGCMEAGFYEGEKCHLKGSMLKL